MTAEEIRQHLVEVRTHLEDELLPFWLKRGVDEEYGGFLTYFDRDGDPTGETVKTLLCQARMIFSYSLAHRKGYGNGAFLERARQGVQFVIRHFWDETHGGWFWTAERDGTPLDRKKIVYGHSFIIYAFAEFHRACGDAAALEWACRTFDLLQARAADVLHGGYYEFFEEDWRHTPPGVYGGDRKSLDVHMHLMEAFTNLFAASGHHIHRRRAREVLDLIYSRMLHPEHGTGMAQFTPDFHPLRAIIFKNVWGSDRDVDDPEGRPLDNTSYGHNVELGWLTTWAVDVLGLVPADYYPKVRRLYEHCLEYGIDRELGGVWCEGPHAGPARERNKEFWQQAETLVAMLDGLQRFGDLHFWEAYRNVHRFVFDHVINHQVGEWYALLGPDNRVIWDYLGHAWKINYHTVRSVIECSERLAVLEEAAGSG